MKRRHRSSPTTCLITVSLLAIGCDLPRDVSDTFTLVNGGTIRVGVTENSPWVHREGNGYTGIEAELLEQLAHQFAAKLQWHAGSESELFEKLHHGELDLMIGGLVQSTPWSHYVGLSQPYLEAPNPHSRQLEKHVWAVRAGENRWLLEVDRFLHSRSAEVLRLVQETQR